MKPFYDPDHGDGWFVVKQFAADTIIGKKVSHVLFAVRVRWHLSVKKVPMKQVMRFYLGPVEIEIGLR